MEPRRVLQAISFGISLTAWAFVVYRLRRATRYQIYIAIMPLVFLAHTAVYYTAVFWFDVGRILHIWSAGLTLHAVITIVILAHIAASLVNNE